MTDNSTSDNRIWLEFLNSLANLNANEFSVSTLNFIQSKLEEMRAALIKQNNVNSIDWSLPSAPLGKYYTVGHALNGYGGSNLSLQDKLNILRVSKELDRISDAWGDPLGIIAWHGRAVCKTHKSRHSSGLAVDVRARHKSTHTLQVWLGQRWSGSMSLTAPYGYIHLDLSAGGGFVPEGAVEIGDRGGH